MKTTLISIFATIVLVGGMFFLNKKEPQNESTPSVNNVTMIDGKQIIEVTAKGGYSPQNSLAQAGIPTVLRFKTEGTFDCSSVISIPSLKVTKTLANSGVTEIDLGTQESGILQGNCGMGMYPFQVEFKA